MVCVLVGGAVLAAVGFVALTSVHDSASTTTRLALAEDLAGDIDASAAETAHMTAQTEKSYYAAVAADPAAAGNYRISAVAVVDASHRFEEIQADAEQLHNLFNSPATLSLRGAATDVRDTYRGLLEASDNQTSPAPAETIAALQAVLLPRIQVLQQHSREAHAEIEVQARHNAEHTITAVDFVRIGLVAESLAGIVIVSLMGWVVGKKFTQALRDVTADRAALLATTQIMERRNGQFQALYQVVSEVAETLSLKYVVQTAIREARKLVGADVVILRLLHGNALEVAGAVQADGGEVSGLQPRRLGEHIVGRAAKRGRSYRVGQDAEHPLVEGDGYPGARSGIVVPLIVGARVVGTLGCWSTQPAIFSADDEQVLEMMASQVATAVVAADTYETTEQQALHDPLTALPNRRQLTIDLHDRYGPELAENAAVAVAMIDIDNFKRFNDEFGHKVGDVTLQRVAEVVRSTLREADSVYRYGGEEFVVLVDNGDRDAMVHLMERVRTAVERTPLTGESLQPVGPVTISVGVAYGPQDSREPETLIKMADAALYDAKHAGRNRVCIYSGERGQAMSGESLPNAA